MKNAISEYIEFSEKEKIKLWKEATFIFDTNIFLRLYGLTKEAREAFFNAVDKINDRIWMPHQVAEEFMKNRIKVIMNNQKNYDDLCEETNNYIKKLSEVFNLNIDNEECERHKKLLQDWIEQHRKTNLSVKDSSNDELLNKILILFNNKTGKPFTIDELTEIETEGAERYKKQIPPGYKDTNKKDTDKVNNMFGDLILWKQILLFSSQNKKNIIFITNDKKEDWWNIVQGKTIGPRVELKKEFKNSTEKIFHMYTLDNFLKYSTENIDEKILEEVKHEPVNYFKLLKVCTDKYNNNYKLKHLKEKADIAYYNYLKTEKLLDKYMSKTNRENTEQNQEYIDDLINRKLMYHNRFIVLQERISKLEQAYKISSLDDDKNHLLS